VFQSTPRQGSSGSESSRVIRAGCNSLRGNTKQQRKHKYVHRDAANAASENMAQDAHSAMVHETGRSNNKKKLGIGCV